MDLEHLENQPQPPSGFGNEKFDQIIQISNGKLDTYKYKYI